MCFNRHTQTAMVGTDRKGEKQYNQDENAGLGDEVLLEVIRTYCVLDIFWRWGREKSLVDWNMSVKEIEAPQGLGLGNWKG